jgi:hypothetical protein
MWDVDIVCHLVSAEFRQAFLWQSASYIQFELSARWPSCFEFQFRESFMTYFQISVFRIAKSTYSLGMKQLTLYYGFRTI